MADVTSLCNQALAAIGTRTTISSIAEQSNEARQCLVQFEPTRLQLLRAAHWGFARSYGSLVLLRARAGTPERGNSPPDYPPPTVLHISTEPPPPWLYTYEMPPWALAIRYILPWSGQGNISPPIFGTTAFDTSSGGWQGPMVKFEIATIPRGSGPSWITCINTNQSQAVACATFNMDASQFDASFARAFVQALASNIAFALTGDLKLLDALVKMTNSLILEARVRSANEGLNAIDIMPDWFRVRGLGPSVGTGSWVAEYGPLFGGVI